MGTVNHLFSSLLIFQRFSKNLRMFSSAKCSNNQIFVILYGITSEALLILKNSLHSFFLSLIDIVGLDITKLKSYKTFFNLNQWDLETNNFNRLIYYNTIDYKTSTRIIFSCFSQTSSTYHSLEKTFFNANWVERELVEFFNIIIPNRGDTRNLLLDYNLTSNPLLKNYPTEGHQELFFNYLSYNLEYVNTEFVEL